MGSWIGLLMCVAGGVCIGAFLLPLKMSRHWAWENSWLIGSVVMFLLLPLIECWLLIPAAGNVLIHAGSENLSVSFIAGLLQGTASVVFTYGVTLMGVSLGYSLMVSMTIVFGTMIPLSLGHPDQLGQPGGIALIMGVCIVVLGSVMAALAGNRREAMAAKGSISNPRRRTSLRLMAIVSIYVGIAASLNYFVLAFQGSITSAAIDQYGVPRALAPAVVLLPWYLGCFASNLVYCIFKMSRDGTWVNYFAKVIGLRKEYFWAVLIGLIWYLGQGVLFLAGYQRLGELGVPVGAALFMASIIGTSNFAGMLTKEWQGAPRPTLALMSGSVAVTLLGIVVIGVGNHLS